MLGWLITVFGSLLTSVAIAQTATVPTPAAASKPLPPATVVPAKPSSPASAAGGSVSAAELSKCMAEIKGLGDTKFGRPVYMPDWKVGTTAPLYNMAFAVRGDEKGNYPISAARAYRVPAERTTWSGTPYKGDIICFFLRDPPVTRYVGQCWKAPEQGNRSRKGLAERERGFTRGESV